MWIAGLHSDAYSTQEEKEKSKIHAVQNSPQVLAAFTRFALFTQKATEPFIVVCFFLTGSPIFL